MEFVCKMTKKAPEWDEYDPQTMNKTGIYIMEAILKRRFRALTGFAPADTMTLMFFFCEI